MSLQYFQARIEFGISVISILAGSIGIFFAALFGVRRCELSTFCNYTVNINTNHSLAVAILVLLILCEILCIGGIIVNCLTYDRLSPNMMVKARTRGYNTGHNVYLAGGHANVITTSAAPEQRPFVGGFAHNRNDNYSADTQIIVGGQVINKGRGGFSGAIIHPPPENTTVHPPVGYYPQDQGATNISQNVNHENVQQLQERNRLLREQIMLQQQLRLIQQEEHHPLPPEPPSYESCLQDPAQVILLVLIFVFPKTLFCTLLHKVKWGLYMYRIHTSCPVKS